MTERTNQCLDHKFIEGCAQNIKKEIDDKIWPAIRGMVPWKSFILIGVLLVSFGLIMITANTQSIAQNEKDIKCLQTDINKKLDKIIDEVKK